VQIDENELPKKILWTNPGGQRRRKDTWLKKLVGGCQDRGRWRTLA